MSQAWEKFLMGTRSLETRKLYDVRMKQFLKSIGKDADQFSTMPPEVAEAANLSYISSLNARLDRKEIAKATLRASINPIRAFCVMNKMRNVDWEIIGKTLPQAKAYASDRAPTIEEIKSLLLHCPLRLRAAVLMQTSGGFREGAFDYLSVGDGIAILETIG